jgi:hypothetical protein
VTTLPALPAIAAELAKELRNFPCTCIKVGAWPLFNADAIGKHKPRQCGPCAALEKYDAFVSIVQLPKAPGTVSK